MYYSAVGWNVLYMSVRAIWCMKVKVTQLCPSSLRPHGRYSPWSSPGQDTGVGSHSFLQGIITTQGLNPGLPHCRQILYQLSHQRGPRIPEWVAYPFSRGTSRPRNRTVVSSIAGGLFPGELPGKPYSTDDSHFCTAGSELSWLISG